MIRVVKVVPVMSRLLMVTPKRVVAPVLISVDPATIMGIPLRALDYPRWHRRSTQHGLSSTNGTRCDLTLITGKTMPGFNPIPSSIQISRMLRRRRRSAGSRSNLA